MVLGVPVESHGHCRLSLSDRRYTWNVRLGLIMAAGMSSSSTVMPKPARMSASPWRERHVAT